MAIWIKKNFVKASFDVVVRDFRQHLYAMGDNAEMLLVISGAVGDTAVFIRLPEEQDYRFLYPGFEGCTEDDLPAFFKFLAGSKSEYRALVQKRAASGNVTTEPTTDTLLQYRRP